MRDIFIYAFRNLSRNKRRTAITLSAVVFATALLVSMDAMMHGFIVRTIDGFTSTTIGKVQAHAKDYGKDRSFYNHIKTPEELLEKADKAGIGASPRSFGFGLVASSNKSAGAMIWGIDPARETKTFKLYSQIKNNGEFIKSANKKIILGKKLAHSLNAKIGAELVLLVQAADGSLGNDIFHVSGIFNTIGDAFDRSAAIIHKDDFEELFVSNGRIHEIAFNTNDRRTPQELVEIIGDTGKTKLKTWQELMPVFADVMNMADVMMFFIGSLFFMAAAIGIMNTMLMTAHERMKEYGMLKAIGTTPARLFVSTSVEAVLIGAGGAFIGSILGLAMAWYLQTYGIDTTQWLEGVTMHGVAFDPVWKAILRPYSVISPVCLVIFMCWLASIYPAVVVARIDAIKAIHHV